MGCGSSSSVNTVQHVGDGSRETTQATRINSAKPTSQQQHDERSRSAKSLKSSRNSSRESDHNDKGQPHAEISDGDKEEEPGEHASTKPVVVPKKELTPEEKEKLENEHKQEVSLVIHTLNEEITYYENDEQPTEDLSWFPAWARRSGPWRPEPWRTEYRERCKERIKTFEYFETRGRLHTSNIQTGDDPNKCVFPLCPDWLKPDGLRWYYTEDYEGFNLELEGSAWSLFEDNQVPVCETDEIHTCFTGELRTWMEDWEPFDLDIEGEAGWDVIDPDLFANDVLTEDQEEVLKSRADRTDMEDRARMTRRQNAMAQRFTEKYEREDDTILKAVQTWASTIREGEEQFLQLCEK